MNTKRIINNTVIVCFLIVISIPGMGILFTPDANKFARYENRQPTVLSKSIDSFEKWFADRLLFRWQLTEAWSKLNYTFSVSSRPDKAVIGSNGWLFLGNYWAKSIDQYRGLERPSSLEIAQKTLFFKQMKRYLKEKHIPLLVVIAPDKQTIYNEYLPQWIGVKYENTRANLLTDALVKENVHVLNLADAELAAKKDYVVYLQGDSHWNNVGGYFGYLAICKKIQELGLQIKFADLANIKINPIRTERNTDISDMLQLGTFSSDDGVVTSDQFANKLSAIKDGKKMQWGSLQAVQNNEIMEKPMVVLNESLISGPKLLFLRDSFGNALSPFIHHSFRETIHLHLNNASYNGNEYSVGNLVNTYAPDAVVFEIVERGLFDNFMLNFIRSDYVDKKVFENSNAKLLFNVEDFFNKEDRFDLSGWGIISGISSAKCRTYIVFQSENANYFFEPQRMIRTDVTRYLKSMENQDLSGFKSIIFKSDLPEGVYKIGVYMEDEQGNRGFEVFKTNVII